MGMKGEIRMKFTLQIDKEREEEIVIYAHQDRPVFREIQRLIAGTETSLVGYEGDSIVVLKPKQISCFVSGEDKVFAIAGQHRYLMKKRLYQLEEQLGKDYIKIKYAKSDVLYVLLRY